MLKLDNVCLHQIGGQTNQPDKQWAKVEIKFLDSDTDRVLAVDLSLAVSRRADATLREVQEDAGSQAIAILEASLAVLKESSLTELDERFRQPI